eukprot:IDg13611t1
MTFAFVAPIPAAASSTFAGERIATAVRPSCTSVRASLSDAIAKRARNDAAKVTALLGDGAAVKGAALAALAAAALLAPGPVNALTRSDIDQLSYGQVKGTGLANRCPEVEANGKVINFDSGKSYKLVDLCLEPKSFQVEEEVQGKRKGETKKSFVDTKLMTRATYTLTGIEGPLTVSNNEIVFEEKEGIDYAATTVQLPGGERVPFYSLLRILSRALLGRGGVTGYDMAVALPALEADGGEGQDELFKETNKVFQVTDGAIEMAVQRIDPSTGELAGVFVSEQLSDTDMGAKAPKKVLLKVR